MKWNLWLGFVAASAVYLGLAIPLWLKMNAASAENSAPASAAFLLAVPYAVAAGIAVFIVCWTMQSLLKI